MNESTTACCEVDHSQHQAFVEQTDIWDRLGILLSSLCAIHCLATPLLLLALPVAGEFFEAEWIHVGMALFVLPVGLLAFFSGFRHHRQKRVLSLGILGLALVAGASFLPHEFVEVGEFDVVTITGGILLVVAHLLNRRACACHKHT